MCLQIGTVETRRATGWSPGTLMTCARAGCATTGARILSTVQTVTVSHTPPFQPEGLFSHNVQQHYSIGFLLFSFLLALAILPLHHKGATILQSAS